MRLSVALLRLLIATQIVECDAEVVQSVRLARNERHILIEKVHGVSIIALLEGLLGTRQQSAGLAGSLGPVPCAAAQPLSVAAPAGALERCTIRD